MEKNHIVAGLDLGSTKVNAVIAEVNTTGNINIIGVGETSSEGMRHGVVINLEKTVNSIKRAVHDAQVMAGIEIGPIYVAITGEHIKGVPSKGVISIGNREEGITPSDVERVRESAKGVAIPAEREIIHTLTQDFIVDHQPNFIDPVGLMGMRLEAVIYIITGSSLALGNIRKAVERAGLTVDVMVLQSLASSHSVLDIEEMQQGVALLDIGGGVTNIAIWYGGSLRDVGIVKLGGEAISRDIAMGMATSKSFAEKLKIERSAAHPSYIDMDEVVEIPGTAGRGSRKIGLEKLYDVVEARVEEILDYSYRRIRRSEYSHNLASGLVLTGGTANIKGILEVAEELFELPVRIGHPTTGLTGMVEAVSSPSFATSIGLIEHGVIEKEENISAVRKEKESTFLDRFKKWISDFF